MSYNQTNLTNLAAALDLDQDQFSQCLDNGTHRAEVESSRQAAVRQGVTSTPTFFINNRRVEGNRPYEVFQSIINQELTIAR